MYYFVRGPTVHRPSILRLSFGRATSLINFHITFRGFQLTIPSGASYFHLRRHRINIPHGRRANELFTIYQAAVDGHSKGRTICVPLPDHNVFIDIVPTSWLPLLSSDRRTATTRVHFEPSKRTKEGKRRDREC